MSPSSQPYIASTGQDIDCGPRTGEFVTLATFGDRRPFVPDPLTERTRRTWSAGDFTRIAVSYAPGAEAFVKRLALTPGERVLDVACGSGNLAIPAARLGARVDGIDIAANLVEAARELSGAERLSIDVREGDAESLPYDDASYDTTISMFGVMFCARPERALSELFRVTRPGGRIALANWAPASFIGEMLKVHAAHVPPPAGVPSPLAWGDQEQMLQRLQPFQSRIKSTRFVTQTIELAFPNTPNGVVELFRETYGPTVRTFGALDADGRASLDLALRTLWNRFEQAGDGITHARSDYVEVLIDVL